MDAARDAFLILSAALIVLGSLTVVVLELGSSAKRRLVSPVRDVVEVLLPVVLILLLLWLVWLDWL